MTRTNSTEVARLFGPDTQGFDPRTLGASSTNPDHRFDGFDDAVQAGAVARLHGLGKIATTTRESLPEIDRADRVNLLGPDQTVNSGINHLAPHRSDVGEMPYERFREVTLGRSNIIS